MGVDSGGTKIDVVICDPNGEVLATARGPGGIPRRIGHEEYLRRLASAIQSAIRYLNGAVVAKRTVELGIGLAGFDWPSEEASLLHLIHKLPGVTDVRISNDIVAALLAGSENGWGICVGAGTGCNCRGLDKTGREFRVIGTGYMFAEYGSGTDITRRAVEAVGHQWTGKGPRTSLSEALLQANDLKTLDILVEKLSIGEIVVTPSFARVVIEQALIGDSVARTIVEWAAHELAELVLTVFAHFPPAHEHLEVVGAGSLLSKSSLVWQLFEKVVKEQLPHAQVKSLEVPATIGAILLTPSAKRNRLRNQIISSYTAQERLLDASQT